MKKRTFTALLAAGLFIWAGQALAEVRVNIGIPLPRVEIQLPRLVISAPPALVVVPDSDVYFAPEVDADLLFYSGYWYRPYNNGWYRANSYEGPWITIRSAPRAVRNLPNNYRRTYGSHERLPYGHVKQNWKSWEKEKRWYKHNRQGNDDRGPQGNWNPGKEERKGKGKHWKD
jgi:hypothetical protein